MSYKVENINYRCDFGFEENVGQYNDELKYVLQKGKYIILFYVDEIYIGIRQIGENNRLNSTEGNIQNLVKFKDFNEKIRKQEVYFFKIKFENILENLEVIG